MKIDANKLSNSAADSSFISLMGGSANGITEIPIDSLVETENQPFNVFDDERMEALVEDIKINGVLEPILVTEENNKYRILAGHRRTHASKLAGKETVPCIIKNVKSGTEKLIITNTNLTQRKEFLPSELAKAYKMQLEGYQELDAHRVRTTAQIAKDNNVSKRTVQYYLKLNNLNLHMLDLVDKGIITVKAGAALSMLPDTEQTIVLKFITDHNIKKIDIGDAEAITNYHTNEALVSSDFLMDYFFPKKEADELRYSTYIVNSSDIDNALFKARQDIIYLDNSKKLKDGVVLKNKDYAKFKKAQKKIEEQLSIIKKIIDKA